LGLSFYIPVSFGFGVEDFTLNVMYNPFYMTAIFNFITWFIPMVLNAIFALQVLYHLSIRQKKRKHLSRPSQSVAANDTQETKATSTKGIMKRKFSWSKLKLKPMSRFQIIIFSYWFQWIGNA
jgi:ABC-type transport system substrate-binding protein